MIINNCEQGTEEWFAVKRGVLSASNFSKIITSTGKITTGETRKKYLYTLAAERISNVSEETFSNKWMEQGVEREEEARKVLSIEYMMEIEEVGFCYLNENNTVGCSPDGLNQTEKIGFEIKCPKQSTHVKYLIDNKIPTDYIQQVQGSLWVTLYDKWVFESYSPALKPLIIDVPRDEEYIKKLSEAVHEANEEIEKIIKTIGD